MNLERLNDYIQKDLKGPISQEETGWLRLLPRALARALWPRQLKLGVHVHGL